MLLFLSGKYYIWISLKVTLKGWNNVCINPFISGALFSKWDVEYQQQHICAVKGSSVVIPCSFYHPENMRVNRVMWGHVKTNHFKGRFISDSLRKITKRFQYIGDKHHNCSLKIHQVEHDDTGKFTVRFINNKKGRRHNVSPTLKVVGKFFLSFFLNIYNLQPVKFKTEAVLYSSRFENLCEKTWWKRNNKGRRLCDSDLHERLWWR